MKCIVTETSPERINAKPVTNEDGTPHVYATISEARAELKANGYSYNRANQRYYINGTEYRAYILRADSEEYAEIMEQAEQEAAPEYIEPEHIQTVSGHKIYRSVDPVTGWNVFTIAGRDFWELAEARYFAQCNPAEEPEQDAAALAEYKQEPEPAQEQEPEQEPSDSVSNQTTAEIIAEQARDLYHDTIYSAITANDIEQADAYTNEHLSLTVEVMDALGISHASDRMLVAIAQAMRWTLEDLEAQAIEEAHDRAARALVSAYAEAIGDDVTEDDPEAIAAHRVARACIGLATATDDDRATVSYMVQAIADRARKAAAAKANQAANNAITDANRAYEELENQFDNWQGWTAQFIEQAQQSAAEAARLAIVANDQTITAKAGAVSAMTRRVREEIEAAAPIYQRYELLAYLGEPDAYDVDAIEAEATRYTADGAQIWTAFGSELAAIAERHELYTYAPAI